MFSGCITYRALKSAKKHNLSFRAKYVNSVSEKENQCEMGSFTKFDNFAYQSEYRIAISTQIDEPLLLDIGSLKDIAKVMEFDNFINSPLKISEEN